MPKFILAAVVWLAEARPPRHDDIHHVRTHSRDATRRLLRSRVHQPYVDLGPLDLSRTRH